VATEKPFGVIQDATGGAVHVIAASEDESEVTIGYAGAYDGVSDDAAKPDDAANTAVGSRLYASIVDQAVADAVAAGIPFSEYASFIRARIRRGVQVTTEIPILGVTRKDLASTAVVVLAQETKGKELTQVELRGLVSGDGIVVIKYDDGWYNVIVYDSPEGGPLCLNLDDEALQKYIAKVGDNPIIVKTSYWVKSGKVKDKSEPQNFGVDDAKDGLEEVWDAKHGSARAVGAWSLTDGWEKLNGMTVDEAVEVIGAINPRGRFAVLLDEAIGNRYGGDDRAVAIVDL